MNQFGEGTWEIREIRRMLGDGPEDGLTERDGGRLLALIMIVDSDDGVFGEAARNSVLHAS